MYVQNDYKRAKVIADHSSLGIFLFFFNPKVQNERKARGCSQKQKRRKCFSILPPLTRQSLLLPLHALFVFSLPEQASCQGAHDQSIWNVDE